MVDSKWEILMIFIAIKIISTIAFSTFFRQKKIRLLPSVYVNQMLQSVQWQNIDISEVIHSIEPADPLL